MPDAPPTVLPIRRPARVHAAPTYKPLESIVTFPRLLITPPPVFIETVEHRRSGCLPELSVLGLFQLATTGCRKQSSTVRADRAGLQGQTVQPALKLDKLDKR